MTAAELATLHAEVFTGSPPPWSASAIAEAMDSPAAFVLHMPDAFLIGRVAGPEAELLTLAVRETARRSGLGRSLLAAFEAEALRRDATEAFLDVAEDNTAAIGLYEAAAYTILGRRSGYYSGANPVDALIMGKPLSDTAQPVSRDNPEATHIAMS